MPVDAVSVDVVRLDSRVCVTVTGELDVATAPRLREALTPLLAADVVIALDLSKVDFIDSTGVGVLIGAMKRLQAVGGALCIEAASPGVQRVLEMTGVTRALGV